MHIYQILLLIGVVIASIMTSYSLVRTFVLLIKSNDVQAKEEKDLEKAVNDFLEETDKEIIDIKYQVSCSIFGEEQIFCFSAMVIYY